MVGLGIINWGLGNIDVIVMGNKKYIGFDDGNRIQLFAYLS